MADHLDQLITASQEISRKDPLRGIYELAWYSMSEYEAGNADQAARQVADMLKDPHVITAEFLYDYRNAVGVLLTLFLTRKARLDDYITTDLSNKVLGIVKKWRWHDRTGEVVFAYSLLSQDLQKRGEELNDLAQMCLSDTKEAFVDNSKLLDSAKDIGWKILAAVYLDKKVSTEIFAHVKERVGMLNELVDSAQMETLTSLLWAFTDSDTKDVSEITDKIAKNLLAQIRDVKELSVDPDFVQRFVNAIQLAKEGLVGQAKQVLSIIEDYNEDHLTVDLTKINVGTPRLSVLAKARIALTKAGFYRPFILSTREEHIHQQILQANKSGLKYLRKYEFAVALIAGAALLLYGFSLLAQAYKFNIWANIGTLIVLMGMYSDIAWGLWKEGAITKHSILRVVRRIQRPILRIALRLQQSRG